MGIAAHVSREHDVRPWHSVCTGVCVVVRVPTELRDGSVHSRGG